LQVSLIIAGIVSKQTFTLFARHDIDVIMGASRVAAEHVARQYWADTPVTEAIARDDPEESLPAMLQTWT